MTAVNNIAKRLRIPSKAFAYAGTKDKRSVSVQAVSVRQVKAESIDKIVNNSWKWDTSGKNMVTRVGNFKYLSHPLKLGDLSGNHFTITMRDVMPNQNPAAIQASVDALRESGFVNYFGMQRFGTRTIGTYEIGIALLKGEWEAAVDLILCPRGDGKRRKKGTKR